MFPDEIGGFLFVPPTRGLSPQEVITRTLDTLTAGATFKAVWVGPYGHEQALAPPDAAALAELARVGEGFVFFDLPAPVPDGFIQPGSLIFAPHASGYYQVGTAFDSVPLRADDADEKDRATVEGVYERWVRCCERLGVEYAYFGSNGVEQELSYAQQELDEVLRHDVKALLGGYGAYWLVYFGAPYLAEPAKELPLEETGIAVEESAMTRQELPSGAVVIRREEFPLF